MWRSAIWAIRRTQTTRSLRTGTIEEPSTPGMFKTDRSSGNLDSILICLDINIADFNVDTVKSKSKTPSKRPINMSILKSVMNDS